MTPNNGLRRRKLGEDSMGFAGGVSRAAPMAAAARWSASWTKWAYMSSVVELWACPSRPAAVRTSTPPVSMVVAAKWRRSWSRSPVEAVTLGEAAEGERDVVRAPWFDAVGSMGEDEGVRREVGAAEGEELARDVSVLGEHPDGSVVERDAPFGVGLGALLDHVALQRDERS